MVWTAADLPDADDAAAAWADQVVLTGAGQPRAGNTGGPAGWEARREDVSQPPGAAGAGIAEPASADGPDAAAGPEPAGGGPAGRPGPRLKRTRRARRDPWRTAFFGVLALAIAGGAVWALLGSSLLVVRHEEVTGNHLVSAAAVRAAAGIRPGTPLASLNTMAAARRVERIAQVQSARVTRSFPDTVVITVRERTPALAVRAAGGYALVDGAGVEVRWSARRPAGLPVLRQPPPTLRGNAGVRAAVTVLGRLPHGLRGLVVAVTARSAASVTLALRTGVTVVWGSPGQDAMKSAEVAALLRTHARYLDVSDPATVVTGHKG